MRICFAALCAALIVTMGFTAVGASPMDSITWETYDTFSGSSLDTSLWYERDDSTGTVSTGAHHLTLSPTPLSSGNKSRVTIVSNISIDQDSFFAANVPFSITSGAPKSGGVVQFSIELDDGKNKWTNVALGIADQYNGFNGTFYYADSDVNSPSTQDTSVTQGRLGLVYSGHEVTMYYNDGTGWQQLGTPNSTAGLTGPLSFWIQAAIQVSGSITVAVPYVQISQTQPPTPKVPGAPTGVNATAGNAQATVSFTAPGSDGGSPITGYTLTSNPGGITKTGTASPITVKGLNNGIAYTFTVKAKNMIGAGPASSASNSVTPGTVPGAPTNVTAAATAGHNEASVSFKLPLNGGSTITGYTVTSKPGGITASGSGSPITVKGLAYGTAYTFTVTAKNGIGSSAASKSSNSVTPYTVPGAPLNVAAKAGNAQATVSFKLPVSNGGSTITGYTVTSSPGGKTATGKVSPITVKGLTNGNPYTFTVTATNNAGTGPASVASSPVTPK